MQMPLFVCRVMISLYVLVIYCFCEVKTDVTIVTGERNYFRDEMAVKDRFLVQEDSFRISHIIDVTEYRIKLNQTAHRHRRASPESVIDSTLGALEDIPILGKLTQWIPKLATKRIKEISKLKLSTECMQDTLQMFKDFAVLKPYATKMFDASSKLPSGVFEGRWIWSGDYEQCQTAKSDVIPEIGRIIEGRHCFNEIMLPKRIQNLFRYNYFRNPQLGSCHPQTCSAQDVWIITNSSIAELGLNVKRGRCEKPLEYTTGSIVAMSVVGVFLCLVFVGTSLDLLLMWLVNGKQDINLGCAKVDKVTNSIEVAESHRVGFDIRENKKEGHRDSTCRKCGDHVQNFILCFSIINNCRKLLHISPKKSEMSAVNGIRVISTIWVIQGHFYQLIQQFTDNSLPYQEIRKRFDFQAILNGTFAVDSFLLISGLLVTYLCLQKLKQTNGKTSWQMFYFHRFWRLTPTFAFVMMGYVNLRLLWYLNPVKYLKYQDINPVQCQTNWWANILYINNFYFWLDRSGKLNDCMYWSWYLAVDMQFYVFSPIIIYLLYKKRKLGIGLAVFLILLCLALRAVIIERYKIIDPSGNANAHFDNIYKHDRVLYDKPYTRMSPYLIGMLLASALYTTKFKVRMNKVLVVIGWMVAVATGLAVIYGRFGYTRLALPMERTEAVVYLTLNRCLWSLSVSWVIFACATGYGGPVNSILSWNIWIPLARLSYCAYLVHPILLTTYNVGQPVMAHYSDFHFVLTFLALMVATYMFSGIVSLVVEAPFMRMEKMFFTSKDDSNNTCNKKSKLEIQADVKEKKQAYK